MRLPQSFTRRLQLQASRVWDTGRRQDKKLKSRVAKDGWQLLLRGKQIMEKDTRDLNHNLLRGEVAQAFEKRCLKETEGKKRQELIQYKKTRQRHPSELITRSNFISFSKRLAVEQKLQRSQEILDQLMEQRIRESKDKALKKEQSFMAKFRAKEKVEDERRHKSMLLNIAESKVQQDPEMLAKTIQQKVNHIKEINSLKERNRHSQTQTLMMMKNVNYRK
ncbi:coiled-coil domain-containing protein 185-like [Strix uralensis]|uniref:coiled-coil domain-containing protein 185-like n=1 Tax=Strix uralensis TaxID=36305 RepID=UPI003DA73DAD